MSDRKREKMGPPPSVQTPPVGPWQGLGAWLRSLATWIGVYVAVRFFLVAPFVITSGSMEASLLEGDFLFADRAAFGARIPGSHAHLPGYDEPALGDVVVFEPQHDIEEKLVKRLVGLGGDTLEMRDGLLYRNGEPQLEPYAVHDGRADGHSPEMLWQADHLVGGVDPARYRPTRDTWGPLVVPDGHYFMLGDNRDASYDSRFWGPLAAWRVEARVARIYFSYDPDAYEPFPLFTGARWDRIGRPVR